MMCDLGRTLLQRKKLLGLSAPLVSTFITVSILKTNLHNYSVSPPLIPKPSMSNDQAPIETHRSGRLTVTQQCGLRKIGLQGENMTLVTVNGTKTLLVSSYQEHRTGKREVRVIAVVQRSEAVSYRCLFCCQGNLDFSEGSSSVHENHFGFAYGTADIMCPLPTGCEKPSYVTVSSKAVDLEGGVHQMFLEVKNQQQKHKSFDYNFTVCISTMFDFNNVLQLVQSLEMMQLLGVDRVVIYKTNCSRETQRILDYYTDKGLVEVIPWTVSKHIKVSRSWLPEHGPGELHYFGQIPALNDCVYRHMYSSKYVALQDIDELILPQAVNSWLELLPLLEQKYGADQYYMFENNVFPNTVNLPPPATQDIPASWQNVSGVNILAHLYQEPTKPTNENYKVIVNPRIVFTPTVHGLLKSTGGRSWVNRNIARMYHTRAPRQPTLKREQLIYDGRLLSYSKDLIHRVNTVLRENRLPEDNIVREQ